MGVAKQECQNLGFLGFLGFLEFFFAFWDLEG
jgi:hypothetical protein